MEKLPSDPNIMPDMRWPIEKLADFVMGRCHFLPDTPLAPSEFPKHPERRVEDPQGQLDFEA